MVLRRSLAFSPPEEGFHGIRGVRVKWSRDLAQSGYGGSATFKACTASHSLVNTFWVRQAGINDGAGVISLAYLALLGIWVRKKSDDDSTYLISIFSVPGTVWSIHELTYST